MQTWVTHSVPLRQTSQLLRASVPFPKLGAATYENVTMNRADQGLEDVHYLGRKGSESAEGWFGGDFRGGVNQACPAEVDPGGSLPDVT